MHAETWRNGQSRQLGGVTAWHCSPWLFCWSLIKAIFQKHINLLTDGKIKTVKEFIFFMWERLCVSLKPLLRPPLGEVAGILVLSRLSRIFSFSLNLCFVSYKLEDNSAYSFIYLVFRNNTLWRFHYLFSLLLSVTQWSAACQELCFSKSVIPFPTAFSQR